MHIFIVLFMIQGFTRLNKILSLPFKKTINVIEFNGHNSCPIGSIEPSLFNNGNFLSKLITSTTLILEGFLYDIHECISQSSECRFQMQFSDISVHRGNLLPQPLLFYACSKPDLILNTRYFLFFDRNANKYVVNVIYKVKPILLNLLHEARQFAAGWHKWNNERWVSQFYECGMPQIWHFEAEYINYPKDAFNRRPSLPEHEDVLLEVKPHDYRQENVSTEYAAGQFKLIIHNTNKEQDIKIPALLSFKHTNKISWENSITIMDSSTREPYRLSNWCTQDILTPTYIESGGSISTMINVLPLLKHNRRSLEKDIHLLFCLGMQCVQALFLSSEPDQITTSEGRFLSTTQTSELPYNEKESTIMMVQNNPSETAQTYSKDVYETNAYTDHYTPSSSVHSESSTVGQYDLS